MSLEAASKLVVQALINQGLGHLVCPAESSLYQERVSSYWSLSAQKKPFCFVHPRNTEDVVRIIKTLKNHPDCHFAIRSGGHVAWGASNIDMGICVDLGMHMHSVAVDKEQGVVSIGPGARWSDVYKKLEPHGVTVAGGRSGGVGVAGFLTGGGISWHIPRVGFGCDQLVRAEVVLAEGRVVVASSEEHDDLWRALKGASAGNFGVVTRLDVHALPYDGLWAGMLVSEALPTRTADHIAAMKAFTDASECRPDSSYIVLWNHEPTIFKNIVITSFAANTKGVENPPELKQLCDIPTIVKDMKHTNTHDFACSMDQPHGYHNFWHTTTFVNDERIMAKAVELHAEAVAKVQAASKTGRFSSLCLFQALPSFYSRLSEERGGNVMGLAQHLKGRNAIMMLLSINVSKDEIREYGMRVAQEYLEGVDNYAKSLDKYIDWTYINYADRAQNPIGSLLDRASLQRTARKYDPTGVFQSKTPNGFKVF